MGGCGSSRPKVIQPAAGQFAQKIKESELKNTNVTLLDFVYLMGGDKVFKFDTKAIKITEVPTKTKFPVRAQNEWLPDIKKIAVVGGSINGEITNQCWLVDPANFDAPTKLPDFPVPVKKTILGYRNGVLYAVGGETKGNGKSWDDYENAEAPAEGDNPDGILSGVYTLMVNGGTAWEKFSTLKMPRRGAMIIFQENILFVFGGVSVKKNRTTQVDMVDLSTKETKAAPFRLPLGVEDADMCWNGDDLLICGGKKIEDRPDSNVLSLDFDTKAIISVRDMNCARDQPIIIPIKKDEVIVFGGSGHKTAEKRAWCEETGDYVFKGVDVPGLELIDNVNNYFSALPSFIAIGDKTDNFPPVGVENRFIFGNEIDCFLIEIPRSFVPNFHASPMRLQQKTGQAALRYNANTIFLCGGTDMTRTKISKKTYMMKIPSGEIVEFDALNEARYFAQFLVADKEMYAIGGKGKGQSTLASLERLKLAPGSKWELLAPLKTGRFGHIAWATPGKLHVFGGTTINDGAPLEEGEEYDIASNTWKASCNL
jgi:hypothetical protein